MKTYYMLIVAVLFFASCDKWTNPDALELQKPFEKPEEYYSNLRAFKASDHQLSFGWFGGWDPSKPSAVGTLKAAPDSMDILALWGEYKEMTKERAEDLKYVQQKLGTKVVYTLILINLPEKYQEMEEERAIKTYAQDMVAKITADGLDGLDIDWEIGITGYRFYFDSGNRMEIFTREVAKSLGPQSGSGKLLIIDCLTTSMPRDMAGLFDYAVTQNYEVTSWNSLQSSFQSNNTFGYPPEKCIYTDTFERGWTTGGKDFTQRNGQIVPAIYGMAAFQPQIAGVPYRKGGAGSYHMEYDYNNTPDYKYMRQMIQIMNPAGSKPIPAGIITGSN